VTDYRRLSLWLDTVPGPLDPSAPLPGDLDVDVAIVGAGYTGLWTAYYLASLEPTLRVAVLERDIAGFGASGRNGGWCSALFPSSVAAVARRSSRDAAVALQRALNATVDEVGRVAAAEGIDCHYRKGGTVTLARTAVQLERARAAVAEARAWGADEDDVQLLGASEAVERVGATDVLGATYTPHCARIHPARLVRGLAEAVRGRGVSVYELTPVTGLTAGRVETPYGVVRAPVVVRATEGYTARLAGQRRALVPLNSAMIVTEPLDAATWARLRWDRAECLLDGRHRYVYLQRTGDGRIAIGGRGVPYRFGSRTDREGPLPGATARELRERLVELFPVLEDAGIAGGWHGVLGVPRDWTPAVGIDRGAGVAWAGGYVGEGVAAANLAGRTLRDLILERETELTSLPWVGPLARPWEPEPLRFAGVRAVNALFAAADARERRTARPALTARLANLVSGR
jgi:glycine/D-amino acid oxidase-like deaminating enzyme